MNFLDNKGLERLWQHIIIRVNSETSKALEAAKESGVFDGADGKDGYTPQKGVDYFDGEKGDTGPAGSDGKTPVKGTDYWTANDRASMVQDVLATLPTWNGGAY